MAAQDRREASEGWREYRRLRAVMGLGDVLGPSDEADMAAAVGLAAQLSEAAVAIRPPVCAGDRVRYELDSGQWRYGDVVGVDGAGVEVLFRGSRSPTRLPLTQVQVRWRAAWGPRPRRPSGDDSPLSAQETADQQARVARDQARLEGMVRRWREDNGKVE